MARQQAMDLDFASVARIVNLPDATLPQHPATLAQVQAAVEGLGWKDDVAAASAGGNINLSAPGATIDGVTMVANMRFLAKDQTAGSENGTYIWNGAATAATRTLDMNSSSEFNAAIVTVDAGTVNAGTSWRQTAVAPVVGTTTIAWTAFGVSAPASTTGTAGVAAIATQAEVDAGSVSNKIVTPQTMAAYAGRVKKFATPFGDGSATQFTITHNLATVDVECTVFRNSGNGDEINCDVEHMTANTIRLTFAVAPTSNQYRVVVIG